jgi:hypothetical protein
VTDLLPGTPEILRQTAKLLADEGWTTGTMYRADQGYCALGGIIQIATEGGPALPETPLRRDFSPEPWAAVKALAAFLHENAEEYRFQDVDYEVDALQWPSDAVIMWNDDHAQDSGFVQSAMLAAADWAEREAAADA